MKILLLSLSFCLSLTAFATSPVGKYTQKHKVLAMMNNTPTKCKRDGGVWDKKEKMCLVSTSDDAEVVAADDGYSLHITTMATNYHSCEFEGSAILAGNKLISQVPSDEYNTITEQIESTTCILTAELTNAGKKMSITTNGKCRSFCGANGWLEVELTKVKK
jgi:hypothetical protein